MGQVIAVCISEQKGTPKQDVGEARLIADFGLEHDAHAGTARQVSLLSLERVKEAEAWARTSLAPGIFGENILASGFDFKTIPVGTRFLIGEVVLEITQIGKECHSGCTVARETGKCIMPTEGVFAKVIKGGRIQKGMEIIRVEEERKAVSQSRLRAAILCSSDRCYAGLREDKSSPLIREKLQKAGYEVVETCLLPDDAMMLETNMTRICLEVKPDLLITTGGTGFSPRDVVPEVTRRLCRRNVPGIAEAIRACSMTKTRHAMLSRAESVISYKTLIINLPGSEKAAEECMDFLLGSIEHGLYLLRGEGDN